MFYFDLIRYQKHLDDEYYETYNQKAVHDEDFLEQLKSDAQSAVIQTILVNRTIRKCVSVVDHLCLYKVNPYSPELPINIKSLAAIPSKDGCVPTFEAVQKCMSKIQTLMDHFTNLAVSKNLTDVLLVGDPRINILVQLWPKDSGIKISTITEELPIEEIILSIKKHCKNPLTTLVIFSLHMRNFISVKFVNECVGHDPCKYIEYSFTKSSKVNPEGIMELFYSQMKNENIWFNIAISPFIPIDFYSHRKVIAERHFANTNHRVDCHMPDSDSSNTETTRMLRDITWVKRVLLNSCVQYQMMTFDIPGSMFRSSNPQTTDLVKGVSLTESMALKVIDNLLLFCKKWRQTLEDRSNSAPQALEEDLQYEKDVLNLADVKKAKYNESSDSPNYAINSNATKSVFGRLNSTKPKNTTKLLPTSCPISNNKESFLKNCTSEDIKKRLQYPKFAKKRSRSSSRSRSCSRSSDNPSSSVFPRDSSENYRRTSRSPKRRCEKSPNRRSRQDTHSRRSPRKSRSPHSRRSRSPHSKRSHSPRSKISRSPLSRRSRSPLSRRSRSPLSRRSRSPLSRRSRSPLSRRSRSPRSRRSQSPRSRRIRSPRSRRSRSPRSRRSRSPRSRRSRSPRSRRSRSPRSRRSQSPRSRRSRSPHSRRSRSPYSRRSRSPYSRRAKKSKSPRQRTSKRDISPATELPVPINVPPTQGGHDINVSLV